MGTKPLRHLRFARCHCPLSALACHLPRPGESFLVGEALAFRDVFRQTQISFLENDTSLPRAPTLGELAPQASERASPVKLLQRRCDTMALTNRACIAVFFVFCQHPCPLRHGFAVPPCPLSALACHLPRPGESFKVRGFGIPHHFREIPETDKIPETPANSTGTVILIYPTRVCFARVSRHKFVTFCWWGAQTLGGYIGQSLQEMADFG